MSLYNELLERYGYNEPIFLTDVSYKKYSKPWIYKELSRLVQKGELVHYDKGVYYIPKETCFGLSLLDPRKVIEKKYVSSDGEVFGYYSGHKLLNEMGLSAQMPNTVEVFSNHESSNAREVQVGLQKVQLRRSRVSVTKDNAAVLGFLETMNMVSADYLDNGKKEMLYRYIRKWKISKESLTEYAKYFPDKVFRTLVESGLIYDVP